MPSFAAAFDATDVPFVAAADLAAALSILSPAGRHARMPRGLNEQDFARIETRLWGDDQNSGTRTATMVRLRCLAETLGMARFTRLTGRHGAGILEPLLAAAATLRLNAERGFNPNRLMWAIEDNVKSTAPVIGKDQTVPLAA